MFSDELGLTLKYEIYPIWLHAAHGARADSSGYLKT